MSNSDASNPRPQKIATVVSELSRFEVDANANDNRFYPMQYRKFGTARLISLDQLALEDGATTIGDQVSRGLWD
jgi:hypothetical protein